MSKHLLFMDNLTQLHNDLYVPASLFEAHMLTVLDGESVHVADATIFVDLLAGKESFDRLSYEGQKTLQEIENNSIIF